MNAPAAAAAADVSTRLVYADWVLGDQEEQIRYHVAYRVDYGNPRDRARGVEPQVHILSIKTDVDGRLVDAQLTKGQREKILQEFETELRLGAPYLED